MCDPIARPKLFVPERASRCCRHTAHTSVRRMRDSICSVPQRKARGAERLASGNSGRLKPGWASWQSPFLVNKGLSRGRRFMSAPIRSFPRAGLRPTSTPARGAAERRLSTTFLNATAAFLIPLVLSQCKPSPHPAPFCRQHTPDPCPCTVSHSSFPYSPHLTALPQIF